MAHASALSRHHVSRRRPALLTRLTVREPEVTSSGWRKTLCDAPQSSQFETVVSTHVALPPPHTHHQQHPRAAALDSGREPGCDKSPGTLAVNFMPSDNELPLEPTLTGEQENVSRTLIG